MMKAPLLLSALFLVAVPASAQTPSSDLSATEVAADIAEWRDWLFATHPDPAFSMNVEAVNARFDTLIAGLSGHYTRREAWIELAQMNPLFADGHVAIRLPREDYDAWIAAGGAEFTLPVDVESERVFVAETVSDTSAFRPGQEICTLNGQPVDRLVQESLHRAHGDGIGLQTYIVETRFSQFLWGLTGGADRWEVGLCTGGRQTLDPLRDVSVETHDQWALDFRGDAAVLTLNTFAPTLEDPFKAFIDEAFAEIAAHGSDVLVIDVSANGGGAHQLSDHVFAYLTDQRHTPLSAVTARITPENQALIPGSQLGQVISTPFAQWIEPPAELENRFEGEVGILVGAGTYSQAIVFAATAQDFTIAPVAGPGTEGRANSTGQVQIHTLSHTGLEVGAPIYVFTRASGDTSSNPVIPDIPLEGPREEQIEALIAALRTR